MISLALKQEQEQERLYHLKNAAFLAVHQKAPFSRDPGAYKAFLTYHTELQERVRANINLTQEEVDALASLAKEV